MVTVKYSCTDVAMNYHIPYQTAYIKSSMARQKRVAVGQLPTIIQKIHYRNTVHENYLG